MDFEQLKSFCLVAEHKSFLKAAEMLKITQPAISRRILSLEQELGVTLLNRSPQSVSLTREGAAFLPYAERTLRILNEGARKVQESRAGESLSIAASSTTSLNFLPRIIKEFRLMSGATVTVYTLKSSKTFDMLLDQTVHAAFTTSVFANSLIQYDKVFEEDICCVCTPEFAGRYMEDGAFVRLPIPVIFNNIETPPWNALNEQLLNNPGSFQVSIRSDFPQMAMKLVKEGIGAGFFPLSDMIWELEAGVLVKLPLERLGVQLPQRPVYLLTYKDNSAVDPLIQQFKETVKSYFAHFDYGTSL